MTLLSDGDRVRLARIGQGWRLEDVAKKIGYSVSYLSKVENDVRPIPKEMSILMDSINGSEWYQIIQEIIEFSYDSPSIWINDPDYILNALDNALKLNRGDINAEN